VIPEGWSLDRGSWHFHRRLWLRYGIRLEYGEYRRIVADIRDGRAVLLRKGPRGKYWGRYAVKLRSGLWIKVLVGKYHLPITALRWRSTPAAIRSVVRQTGDLLGCSR
jgi:hypothetical protein